MMTTHLTFWRWVPAWQLLLMGLSLAGLTYLPFHELVENGERMALLKGIRHLTEEAVEVGEVVHQFQIERGRSAVFTAGGEAKAREEMEAQWLRSDAALERLARSLHKEEECVFEEQMEVMAHHLEDSRLGLTALRRGIVAGEVRASEAIRRYSEISQDWLRLLEQAVNPNPDAGLVRLQTGYLGLLWAKEWSGRQRAVMSTFFFDTSGDQDPRREFIALEAVRQAHLQLFAVFASPSQRGRLAELERNPLVREVERWREMAMALRPGATMDGEVKEWFHLATQWIDLLHALEGEMARELMVRADAARSESANEYYAHWVMIGVTVAWSVGILGLLFYRATAALAQMVRSRERMEEDLRRSALSLEQAQRLGHMGNWSWEPGKGEEWHVSLGFRGLLGLSQGSSVTLNTYLSLVPAGRERESVQRFMAEALQGGPCAMPLEHGITTLRRERRRILVCLEQVPGEGGGGMVVMGTVLDITERKDLEERMRHLAHHDTLTGLPNRLMFNEFLSREVASAQRHQRSLAVLFLDLDGFKPVNDTHGHEVGDCVLREVALRLRGCLRGGDILARLGGDEFTLLLADPRGEGDVTAVAEKVIGCIATPFPAGGGEECRLGVSVGIALFPRDGRDGDELVGAADKAMYAVKMAGKNGYRYYDAGLVGLDPHGGEDPDGPASVNQKHQNA